MKVDASPWNATLERTTEMSEDKVVHVATDMNNFLKSVRIRSTQLTLIDSIMTPTLMPFGGSTVAPNIVELVPSSP